MKKILVTGGVGFIGSHVVQELVKRGIIPVIYDNHYFPKQRRFDFSYAGYENYCADIRDQKTLMNALRGVDGVIHLAGILGTPETLQDPQTIRQTVDVNIQGSLNVFDAIRSYDIPCVYIQTGNGKNLSPYPITKDCAADFAFTYNKEFGTRITVIRGLVAYGERQKHLPIKKIMPTFMVQAIKGEDLTINGNGEQRHDFIYARDLACVLIDAFENDKYFDRAIDGGSGYVYSVNQIAELVIKAVDSKSKIYHTAPLPNGNVRMGEPANDAILSDNSRNLLKEYTHRKVEDVIDQITFWYKNVYSEYL
jgi:UDP-glucose 4-epimerase